MMHKTSWTFAIYAFVTGAFAVFLRWLENKNCYEAETGLFISGSAISTLLVILLVVSAVGLYLMALTRKGAPVSAETALKAKSPLCTALSAVMGLVLLGACLALFASAGGTKLPSLYRILAILGAAGGVCLFFAVRAVNEGRADAVCCFCFVVVTVFYCFWLIVCYKVHDSEPVIRAYAPELLAIVSGLLAWFYLAGVPFGKAKPVLTIFFCGMSFVLALAAMPDERHTALSLMLLAPSVCALALSWLMLRNIRVENRH